MTASTATLNLLRHDFIGGFPKDAAQTLERMPTEDITPLLGDVGHADSIATWEPPSPDVAQRTLASLPPDQAVKLLSYPEDNAGAMMDPKVLLLRPESTVTDTLRRARQLRRRGIRVLFVVNPDKKLEGTVDVQDLATSAAHTTLDEIMRPVKVTVNVMASREEVVGLLDQHRLTDLPVVDLDERLVGAVRHTNLVAAAEDEATAAIQTMVGVSRDERALSSVGFAVRKRLPWLPINLAIASLAAAVVGLFESRGQHRAGGPVTGDGRPVRQNRRPGSAIATMLLPA